MGHQVNFINPTNKWKLFNLFSFKVNTTVINKNLSILNYKNNFPQGRFSHFFTPINDFFNTLKIKHNISTNKNHLIWWKFDPYRFLNTYPLNKAKKIYHVVDPHIHIWQNDFQAKKANLIVCSSNKYSSYYKKNNCKHVLEIAHGISEDEFKLDMKKVDEIKNHYGKFIILIGTIANNVDIKLLEEIALKKINLLIIGSETIRDKEWSALKELNHIHYLGVLNAKELNNYIAASQAGLISYQFIPKTNQVARTPLKALNYLAQHKPIITSIDSEIEELKDHGIYRAKNAKEYVFLVQEAINSTLNLNIEKVNQYLENHKYPILINTILNQLEKS